MFELPAPFQSSSRRQLAGIVAAALLALAVMTVIEGTYRFAEQAVESVRARDAARFDTLLLRSLMADAETAQRGFLLTGHDDYLKPMQVAEAQLPLVIERLSTEYKGSQWASLVAEARQRADEKLSELRTTVALYRAGSHESWQSILQADFGREKMEALSHALQRLEQHESNSIASDRAAIYRALMFGRFGVHALTLSSLAWLLYYLRRNQALHAARREHTQILREERDRLEREVRRRTAELTDLARYLQTVREDERAHLARELHDELGALLTAAKLDVTRVRRLAAKGLGADIDERLKHMGGLIDEGITLKRRIIEDLRPSALSNLGLTPALEILAREFGERASLEVQLTLDEVHDKALGDDGRLAFYRLVQEALTNVLRHAKARSVHIELKREGDELRLSVRDDGKGFDPAAVPAGHHGLLGMRYRLENLGGTLSLRSAPGRGTEIEARLPCVGPGCISADSEMPSELPTSVPPEVPPELPSAQSA
ncbi:CHASE3 domain-containing protein [Burkholderiaceae bacterium UC74_6]